MKIQITILTALFCIQSLVSATRLVKFDTPDFLTVRNKFIHHQNPASLLHPTYIQNYENFTIEIFPPLYDRDAVITLFATNKETLKNVMINLDFSQETKVFSLTVEEKFFINSNNISDAKVGTIKLNGKTARVFLVYPK